MAWQETGKGPIEKVSNIDMWTQMGVPGSARLQKPALFNSLTLSIVSTKHRSHAIVSETWDFHQLLITNHQSPVFSSSYEEVWVRIEAEVRAFSCQESLQTDVPNHGGIVRRQGRCG